MKINNQLDAAIDKIFLRPTYTEVVEGFDDGGGTTTPSTPTIIRVVTSGRTITPMWDSQYNLTNFSHYLIQVSEDLDDWYSLGFQGDWYDTLNDSTVVYGNSIMHTQVPHNDDESPRSLYYRVASITYNNVQSEWSSPVAGSTAWFYEGVDYKAPGDYVYTGFGRVSSSGDAYVLGPNDYEYVMSGSISSSGQAGLNVLDYLYVFNPSGGMSTYGTGSDVAFVTHDPWTATGGVDVSGNAYEVGARLYYNITNERIVTVSITVIDVDNTEHSYQVPPGATIKHYGPEDYGALPGLESAGYITIAGPYSEDI